MRRPIGVVAVMMAAACSSSSTRRNQDAAVATDQAVTDGAAAVDLAGDLAGGAGDLATTKKGDLAAAGTLSALNGKPATGSTGCGLANAKTGMQSVSMTVDSATRTGLYVVPAGYDDTLAYPVVFVFHGDGGTGSTIRTSLNLETAAAGKAIFVYPDGAGMTWDATIGGADNQDMDFVMALRAQLRTQYCVDLHRTFATGHSRGAYFVNQLACQYGNIEFAGMAPHSGTISAADSDTDYVYGPFNASGGPYIPGEYDFVCPADGTAQNYSTPPAPAPPPMFIIHGQCDTEDGVTFAEGVIAAEHWAYPAQCSSTPDVIIDANNPVTCATATNTACPTLAADPCYKTPDCLNGHDITFCAIPNMPHTVWCDAPARIWAFFAAH